MDISILILVSVTNLTLGYLTIHQGIKKKINLIFFLLTLFIIQWSVFNYFGDYFAEVSINEKVSTIYTRLTYLASSIIAGLFFVFVIFFPRQRKKLSKMLTSGLIIASIVVITLSFTTHMVEKVNVVDSQVNVSTGSLFFIFIIYFAVLMVSSFVILIRKYILSEGIEKIQIRYFFLGTFLATLFASITNIFIPLLTGSFQASRFGPYFTLFFVAFTAYAIIKHRFLDIRFILRKSFIYVGLAVFVSFAYYFALWLDNTLFGGSYSIGGYLSAIAIAPLFLLGFGYVSRWLKHIANKYFFTGLYDYQEVLETFAKRISQTIELDEAVNVVVETIQGAMRVDNIAIALSDPSHKMPFLLHRVIGFNKEELENICDRQTFCSYLQSAKKPIVIDELLSASETKDNPHLIKDAKYLKDLGVALILPLVVQDNVNSVCIVGRKITKEAYTKEDIDLLTTLSNQASVAIENARLYQEVQDFNQNLQQKVEDQTRDIKEANKRLEKLLQIRSEFLDIASHQLRTPVSMIRGVLSMIREGDLEKLPKAKQKKFIENAWEKGAKLDTIINDILAASELDTQKFQVEKDTPAIQLEDVVDQVVKESQMEAEQRKIELKWYKPKTILPKIQGHTKFLNEAISNLVSNALKYTPSTEMVKEARTQRKQKGVVEVEVEQKDNNVVVKVKDNGIGIPKDEIKNLFDKFARASNATAMYTDGSGLGLFIVKEIVEGHKGKVWVESEEGKGSTFYVSLPVAND